MMKFIIISSVLLGCCVICKTAPQPTNAEIKEDQVPGGPNDEIENDGIFDGGIPHNDLNLEWTLISQVKNKFWGIVWWAVGKWNDESAQTRLEKIKKDEYNKPNEAVFYDLDSMIPMMNSLNLTTQNLIVQVLRKLSNLNEKQMAKRKNLFVKALNTCTNNRIKFQLATSLSFGHSMIGNFASHIPHPEDSDSDHAVPKS